MSTNKNNKLTSEDIEAKRYAVWILEECDAPINEIEWLFSKLSSDVQNEIRDNVLKFIK